MRLDKSINGVTLKFLKEKGNTFKEYSKTLINCVGCFNPQNHYNHHNVYKNHLCVLFEGLLLYFKKSEQIRTKTLTLLH